MATERVRQPPQTVTLVAQRTPTAGAAASPASPSGPSKKAAPTGRGGARRLGVDEQGQFLYKNTPSSTLMASLQLGLQHSIGSIAPKPRRDILMTDFEVIETTEFPAAGSDSTPGHKYKDFTFKTYSPEAFRFFREAFGILPEDFLVAMCDRPLRELSNPGASGSLFYLSADDAFIMKTVQKKEARFLQKLLPGYYLNMTQHKRTLLPKFFGLYRYKSGSVNIRIVVMNNLLPSGVIYHEKFDLKGSTYKRKANSSEVKKKSPTFKDLDFMEKHEEGIILAPDKYDALLHSVERDCKVLESFGIMDYSLLLGVHNIDQAIREKAEASQTVGKEVHVAPADAPIPSRIELSKNFSIISAEDIPSLLAEEQQQRHHYPEGYIQGRIHGDRVMFYLGVIDILQSYRFKKKLEHGFKSVIADGSTVSVHNPTFYARRFQEFMTTQVFKKDKIKYKTRKNSTNSQIRGRRITQSGGRAQAVGGADRRAVGEARLSPPTDLPSYNQAMKGTGAAGASLEPGARARSKSASVATSLPAYTVRLPSTGASGKPDSKAVVSTEPSTTTTTTSKATSEESSQPASSDITLKTTPNNSEATVQSSADTGEGGPSIEVIISDPGLIRATENVARAEEQIRSSQKQVSALKDNPSTPIAESKGDRRADGSQDEQDGRKTPENSETEFARNVRGTSTPLNPPSMSPSQSRTFNASNGDITAKENGREESLEGIQVDLRNQLEQEKNMDESSS